MKTKQNPDVKLYYPILFKKLCGCCEELFVREPGWKHRYYVGDGKWNTVYLCKECMPTFKDAYIHWHGKSDYEILMEYNKNIMNKREFKELIMKEFRKTSNKIQKN
jgi:hypothetical protein